jgi:2-phosphosulfolactate phosphatase
LKINFLPTIEQAARDSFAGTTAVVIDVLRFSSAVVAALEAGASRIIPVEDIETATRLADSGKRKTKLLAGERKGLPIEGFDLFNSPAEFTQRRVKGKTIIMTTSNGSRGVLLASKAARTIICSINNIGAVAGAVRDAEILSILCCGSEGRVEDLYCGGLLLHEVADRVDMEALNDAGRLAMLLSREWDSAAQELLVGSDRGRELAAFGYGEDVLNCSRRDTSAIVPVLRQGAIRIS